MTVFEKIFLSWRHLVKPFFPPELVSVVRDKCRRVPLRKWKTNVIPNLREWLDAIVETTSYEAVHHKLKSKPDAKKTM